MSLIKRKSVIQIWDYIYDIYICVCPSIFVSANYQSAGTTEYICILTFTGSNIQTNALVFNKADISVTSSSLQDGSFKAVIKIMMKLLKQKFMRS